MSSEPTPCERSIAAELDVALLQLEQRGLGPVEHGRAIRELLQGALAAYREELAAATKSRAAGLDVVRARWAVVKGPWRQGKGFV